MKTAMKYKFIFMHRYIKEIIKKITRSLTPKQITKITGKKLCEIKFTFK